MCVKLNSLFDIEMKIYFVTQVSTQGPNSILEFRNTKSLLLQVYQHAWTKIETFNENQVC